MKKQDKTNVVRILEQKKLPHKCYLYGDGEAISGVEVASILGQDVCHVFKTLVTQGASKNYYVF
ncbi:MAG: Cys-tRNA(Pro) deacylase, partial [Clostridia bacterium]|nr:Cys-tRNA(Pro) deacylase [Clostridia bacterium]